MKEETKESEIPRTTIATYSRNPAIKGPQTLGAEVEWLYKSDTPQFLLTATNGPSIAPVKAYFLWQQEEHSFLGYGVNRLSVEAPAYDKKETTFVLLETLRNVYTYHPYGDPNPSSTTLFSKLRNKNGVIAANIAQPMSGISMISVTKGTITKQVLDATAYFSTWSSDGSMIAVCTGLPHSMPAQAYCARINPETLTPTPLTELNALITNAQWLSFDHTSKLIAALIVEDASKKITIFNVHDSRLRVTMPVAPTTISILWSPTKHLLATSSFIAKDTDTMSSVSAYYYDLRKELDEEK
jgi:hypothetical protein